VTHPGPEERVEHLTQLVGGLLREEACQSGEGGDPEWVDIDRLCFLGEESAPDGHVEDERQSRSYERPKHVPPHPARLESLIAHVVGERGYRVDERPQRSEDDHDEEKSSLRR
jgi:hypothetical protein